MPLYATFEKLAEYRNWKIGKVAVFVIVAQSRKRGSQVPFAGAYSGQISGSSGTRVHSVPESWSEAK